LRENESQLPVKFFNTSAEIDAFIKSPTYRIEDLGICLAVIMEKNSKGDYEYTIRNNASALPSTKGARFDPLKKYSSPPLHHLENNNDVF
jgi:hypothetical protein